MMNQPPIDELAAKMGGNKYRLSCIVAKRAKELEKRIPEEINNGDKKAITLACEEIYNGYIVSNGSDEE